MWVDAARRWAARGVPSVRLDFHRVGESDGDEPASIASLHGDDLVEQLSLVMDSMQSRLNCQRFIAVGLCSGAFASFQAIIRNPAIRSVVLLNPRLLFWDPEAEPRRLAKRVGTGLGDVSYWRRLARGEIQPERIKQAAQIALTRILRGGPTIGRQRQLPAEALAKAWDQVKRFQTRVTLVFADGEPLIQEMTDENQLPPANNPLIQCVRVGKTGHTFRSLWAQQVVQDLIDYEITSTIQAQDKFRSAPQFTERTSALA
jgi:pimeloyl-ACP methyl ester carboxylesterase